jgi:tetratricopeptide (TPR) repeat protein
MSSPALCLLCTVILVVPVLAANNTTTLSEDQLNKYFFPERTNPGIEFILEKAPSTTRTPSEDQLNKYFFPERTNPGIGHIALNYSTETPPASKRVPGAKVYSNITPSGLIKKIGNKVEPMNPEVHGEAYKIVALYSGSGNYTIDQVYSIYNYLKNGDWPPRKGWIYASDPRGSEYFNYANESLNIGSGSNSSGVGDCDDFAILMASLIESIGGTTRIILAYNNSTKAGHAYAEVYLGNNSNSADSQANRTINWLKKELKVNTIFTDPDQEDIWLNLDWGPDENGTAHPGGPFFLESGRYIINIQDDREKTPINLPSMENRYAYLSPAKYLDISMNITNIKSADGWYNVGIALLNLGKCNESIEAFRNATILNNDSAEAWNNMGYAFVIQGRYNESIEAFEEAINLRRDYAEAWNNIGYAIGMRGLENYNAIGSEESWHDFIKANEEALQDFGIAIKLKPNLADAWNNKGIALSFQADYNHSIQAYNDSIRAYETAIELDPGFSAAWYNKAKTEEAVNQL